MEDMTQFELVQVALDAADHSSAALGLREHLKNLLKESECQAAVRVNMLIAELVAFSDLNLTNNDNDNDW